MKVSLELFIKRLREAGCGIHCCPAEMLEIDDATVTYFDVDPNDSPWLEYFIGTEKQSKEAFTKLKMAYAKTITKAGV